MKKGYFMLLSLNYLIKIKEIKNVKYVENISIIGEYK